MLNRDIEPVDRDIEQKAQQMEHEGRRRGRDALSFLVSPLFHGADILWRQSSNLSSH